MKTISRLLAGVTSLVVSLASAAAETPPARDAFLRIANAVALGTGPLVVEIDGQSQKPAGYKPGAVTGAISVTPGGHGVKFSCPGLESGATRLTAAPGETLTLIAYVEPVPAKETAPPRWQIKILRLRQQAPPSARQAVFANVSARPELIVETRAPAGAWTAVSVKRLAIARAPIQQTRGYVPLRTAAGPLASIPVAARGNYVIILSDGPDGATRSLSFHDRPAPAP